jgi:hypothetical protein
MPIMPLRKIKTEPEILKKLNLSRKQLDVLRLERNLPFIKLSNSVRVYKTESILEWLNENEIIMSETDSETDENGS